MTTPHAHDPSKATQALVEHCYEMLVRTLYLAEAVAKENGILLTADTWQLLEEILITCLIQSGIGLARLPYRRRAFSVLDPLEVGRIFVELGRSPEFRAEMERRICAAATAEKTGRSAQ